ncbi:MAG TPA: helix-turn-helix domain-containing protein, partial [Verrucomicrobiae bacterium]
RLHREGETAVVEFFYLEAQAAEPDVLVDVCLAWITSIARRGTDGQVTPLRVELRRPLQQRELLEQHYGCRVKFKAARNALVFAAGDLDQPFSTFNQELLTVLGGQLESELQAQRQEAGVIELVRKALRRSLAGRRPTIEEVARELAMSGRTLQRRLTQAGITFQKLVEDTRRELAHHYLKNSGMELNEAAYLLGYEDANSFFRAFHLWEGTTPGEWRSRHREVVLARG